MTQYPESGVKLVVDSREYTSAMDYAIFQADYFDSLGTLTIGVEADVDLGDAESAIEDLPLDGETISFTVEADAEIDSELTDLPADGETINTEVDIQETDVAKETLDAVNTLKNLKIIETIWNIAGNAVELFGKFKEFAVEPMLDLEDAVARVNAQTHNAIPDADKLIRGIFYDDLGDSIDQVGKLVIKAAQIKAPIDEAVRAALTFTHTFQDENPEQVLDALNQMVIGKLAPNFTEAGDLLVRAFQTSANRGGDLLQVIGNNAIAIHDLGLTGPEALSFIKTGMDAGFKSAQQVVDVLLKIKQNVTNAAGNATSDVSKTLKMLGIANPSETGEEWSAEFFESVIDKIKNAPGLSDTDKEALFTNLVGGKQGGKTFSAFLEISPDEARGIFKNVAGAADEAATEADNSLRGAIDDFMLAANKAAQEFLSSDQVDLPGKIAALKEGLQGALDVLGNDGTLGEALTIALKPIGFDDEFQGLEKMLGDFVIGILQAVASIQETTRHFTEAAGTRATIEKLGKQQLAFDLSIANPDEISAAVATATSRGLAASEVTTQVSNIIDELVATGTKDTLDQAQLILDEFKKNAPNLQIAPDVNGEQLSQAAAALADGGDRLMSALEAGIVIDVSPNLTPENAAVLQEKINEALRTAPPPDVIDQLSASMGILDDATKKVSTTSNETVNPLYKITDATRQVGTSAKAVYGPMQNTAGALDTVTGAAIPTVDALFGVGGALDAITNKATAFNTAAGAATDKANAQTAGGLTQTENATGGNFVGTSLVGEQGREIVSSNKELSVLNNMTTEAIMAALQSFVPGGSFTRGGGSSYTAINNNIVQSEAQADALGYRTASQLRGMSGA